jgi:hypothetical protein
MKYAVDIASGGMIHTPSLIKIGSGVQKLLWGDSHTHKAKLSHKHNFIFSK